MERSDFPKGHRFRLFCERERAVTKGTHTPADPEIALSRLVADQVETRVGSVQAMPEQPMTATHGGELGPVELGRDSEREDARDVVQPASAGDNTSENRGPGRHEAAYSQSYGRDATRIPGRCNG
jgi:hypothetical protein